MANFKCPMCKKPVSRQDADFPFCSERCRIIDLGNWAAEKYVISTPATPSSKPQDEAGEE
jgi:endogenous inhibitor of DNA gyrase (YacG/DUF329 family)